VTLSRRLPVFAWNVGRNRSNNDNREPLLKLTWPYVMNSSVQKRGCQPSKNDMRSQAASLTQKWKQTATYILRCTMQLVTSPASLSVKYLQNRSGVRFAQPFLVGLPHGFLFTLALRRSLPSVNLLSLQLLGKHSGT
jgi:hypothetical protein